MASRSAADMVRSVISGKDDGLYSLKMVSSLLAITDAPLDLGSLIDAVSRASDDGAAAAGHPRAIGAVSAFIGVVRGENLGHRVLRLEYEAYAPLAQQAFARIREEIAERWDDVRLGLHHRVGVLEVGEASVAIVTCSPHRAHAFAGCRYAIERIKQIAPIWKREFFDGGDVWIEGATADPDDEDARQDAYQRACV